MKLKKLLVAGALAAVVGTTASAVPQAKVNAAVDTSAAAGQPVTAAATLATAQQRQFVLSIANQAMATAQPNGLYTSVMMAQAILESGYGSSQLSLPPYYNLFGIKGDYNGASVTFPTLEWDKNAGKYVTVQAAFRQYPNFTASFQDNADKLRNGVSWDPVRYQGTWIENTTSYQDATAALTGTYATAPDYGTKLNRVITNWNLTQYDTQYTAINAAIYAGPNGATVYDDFTSNGTSTGRVLPAGSAWKAMRSVNLNGVLWYNLGSNQWVQGNDVTLTQPGSVTSFRGVGQINYVPGYGIAIWTNNGHVIPGRYLQHGTRWQLYLRKIYNGRGWYNLGGDQWIDSQYIILR